MQPGHKLGPYEIIDQLGVGGMGQVYRALDTRLDRRVAVKVLHPEYADDAERLARFEQEARASASIGHANIASVYDLGQEGDVHYLVQELLQGHTLRTVIGDRPVAPRRALALATEIAEALVAAHGNGIAHRDLKPENIFVTEDGHAKVLDFGLAKLLEVERTGLADDPGVSMTPTEALSPVGTKVGQLMGSPGYMSPEQVDGREIDHRTDIFSFGCVFYEMLSGQRAFSGRTPIETMHQIQHEEPPSLLELQPELPGELQWVLSKCLAKDVDERYQHTKDLVVRLRHVGQTLALSGATSTLSMPGRLAESSGYRPEPAEKDLTTKLSWAAGGLAVGVLVTGLLAWALTPDPAPARSLSHFRVALEADRQLLVDSMPSLALSPDGSELVFAARASGSDTTRLFRRSMGDMQARPILGTEGAQGPFFSPDGAWIGYLDAIEFELKKVALAGGAPVTVASTGTPFIRGATWTDDDRIVFAPSSASGIHVVDVDGGSARQITAPDVDGGEKSHRLPSALPGRPVVLFTRGAGDIESFDDAEIALLNLDTGEIRVLLRGGSNPRYASSGHIVFARAGSLLAAPFDLTTLEVTGGVVPIVDNVVTSDTFGAAQYSLSTEGTLALAPGGPEAYHTRLSFSEGVDATSPVPGVTTRSFRGARMSPTSGHIAAWVGGANDQIWVHHIDSGTFSLLTSNWDNMVPVWTPDGAAVTYASTAPDANRIMMRRADRTAAAVELLTSDERVFPTDWSPDGAMLAYSRLDPYSGWDLWLLPVDSDREPVPLLGTRFDERFAVFSPDGRWLAYASNESGAYEVYVRPYPGPGESRKVSPAGGTEPSWIAGEPMQLVFRNNDQYLAVRVSAGSSFAASSPRTLHTGTYRTEAYARAYDVTADGRLTLVAPGDRTAGRAIDIVAGWPRLLESQGTEQR